MVRMRRAGLVAGVAVAAFLMGGCGADPYPEDPVTPRATEASPSPTEVFGIGGDDSLSSSTGPEFPLTLHRTGGIAGFDDRIVLEANGKVLVETRSVHGRVCTLERGQQRQLVSVLATLRLGPPSSDTPSDDFTAVDPGVAPESDPITISVTDDKSRQIDLRDPSLGEIASLVGSLVSDVTLSVPATTRCTTPTTPASPPAAP
ncbi:hypothetical protein GCM10027053_09890 [Intrasporangium mesophilum]